MICKYLIKEILIEKYYFNIGLIQHNLQFVLQSKTDHGTLQPDVPWPCNNSFYSLYKAKIFGFFSVLYALFS